VCEESTGECAEKWPDVYAAWLSRHEEQERESFRRRAAADSLTVRDEMFGEKAVVYGNLAGILAGGVGDLAGVEPVAPTIEVEAPSKPVEIKGPPDPVNPPAARATPPRKTFTNQFPDDPVGPPIQVYAPEQLRSVSQRLNYVVTEDGELVVGRIRNEVGGGHIDLAGGRPVQAAGEFKVLRGGDIRYVDNSSGHYLPQGPEARAAAEAAFREAGFGEIPYVEKVWVEGKGWVPK
jgi:hypothetical protein